MKDRSRILDHDGYALAYAKKLRAVGFTEQQALATKHDIALIQADIKHVWADLKCDLKELESKILIKLGTMIFALGGFLVAIKFLA